MALLTFIIPVRHQDNARDWDLLCSNLEQTVKSINGQKNRDFKCLIVANEGAQLPSFPEQFEVVRVNFSPNLVHDKGQATHEDFLDAFRLDKGRRVLAAMLQAKDSKYFMIVDDDDFVNNKLVAHVAENIGTPGWVIRSGYVWDSGGRFMLKHNDLNSVCGTTLIIRSDLYNVPETFDAATQAWIKDMLGSHRRICTILADQGNSLQTLPFAGAVYRVANMGSHSQSDSIFRAYVNLSKPRKFLKNFYKLRILNKSLRASFFG